MSKTTKTEAKTREAVRRDPVQADKAAQDYAFRVWSGQSPNLTREDRLARVLKALKAQGLSTEGIGPMRDVAPVEPGRVLTDTEAREAYEPVPGVLPMNLPGLVSLEEAQAQMPDSSAGDLLDAGVGERLRFYVLVPAVGEACRVPVEVLARIRDGAPSVDAIELRAHWCGTLSPRVRITQCDLRILEDDWIRHLIEHEEMIAAIEGPLMVELDNPIEPVECIVAAITAARLGVAPNLPQRLHDGSLNPAAERLAESAYFWRKLLGELVQAGELHPCDQYGRDFSGSLDDAYLRLSELSACGPLCKPGGRAHRFLVNRTRTDADGAITKAYYSPDHLAEIEAEISERHSKGHYQPFEAATIISEAKGMPTREVLGLLLADHGTNRLRIRDGKLGRAIQPGQPVRASFDVCHVADLDKLLREYWDVDYSFAELVGGPQPVDNCPESESGADAGAALAAVSVSVHSTKSAKSHPLDHNIADAQARCKDPNNYHEVFAHLEALANNEAPPLLASTPDGLKYTIEGKPKYFSKEALRRKLERAGKRKT